MNQTDPERCPRPRGCVAGSGWQGVVPTYYQPRHRRRSRAEPTLSARRATFGHHRAARMQQPGPVCSSATRTAGAASRKPAHDSVVPSCTRRFAPDKGESSQHTDSPIRRGRAVPPICARRRLLFLDGQVSESFAADVPPGVAISWPLAGHMGARLTGQSRSGVAIKTEWYMVATEDRHDHTRPNCAMSERAGATVAETPASPCRLVPNPTW